MIDMVGDYALIRGEGPAVAPHQGVNHRQANHGIELFDRTEDQAAMRPRTSKRDIQVITACLGLEATLAGRPGRPVCRDPIAELRFATNKSPARAFGVIPLIGPLSIYQ